MPLEPTSERVVEELYRSSPEMYLIYLFHKITYDFSREYVVGRQVLDYGCGSGYGTRQMAAFCRNIVGVDIAVDAIEYAQDHYQADNLVFRHIESADREPLPYADASFHTVLSFQVIEHIADPDPYLSEVQRVLKPGGFFICATPDRTTRLLPGQKPWNVWHDHEYDALGFKAELDGYFERIEVLRMGGKVEVLAPELRRTRRLAWLTLPVTLPFLPEKIRITALRSLKWLAQRGGRRSTLPIGGFPFDESDLVIAPEVPSSVNLIAVARKS